MHYNPDGTFVGGELLSADDAPRHQAVREVAWSMAEEFTSWWKAHPEYHRENHPVV